MSFEQISVFLAQPAWDVIVLVFFGVAGSVYGVMVGRMRLIAIFFALYVSQLLFEHFAFLDRFVTGKTILEIFFFRATAFIILLILLSLLFIKTVFRGRDADRPWWQIFFLSFLEVGLLVSAIFRLMPARELFTFSPVVNKIFASDGAYFLWLTLPLVGLFVIVRGSLSR